MALSVTKYLDAGYPVLYVRTSEHNRALDEILADLRSGGLLETLSVMVWKSTTGLYDLGARKPKEESVADSFIDALSWIGSAHDGEDAPAGDRLYIMFNPKEFLKNPVALQHLKDAAYAIRAASSYIVLVGCSMDIPEEIEDVVTIIDLELPDKKQIKDIFASVTGAYSASLGREVSDDELETAAENALGLSAFKAENAISLSIVASKGIDIQLIRKEKQLAVKQTGVLEYIHHRETLENLGGFDNLKEHVLKRKRYFSDYRAALDFGLRPPKGLMLVGIAGCVAGDTEVLYRRGKRRAGRRITVENLYRKFNGLRSSTRPWEADCDTFLPSYSAETGRIAYNRVVGVYDKGRKDCLRIITDCAGSVVLTADHPVLNADGLFHPAGEIAVGDELLVRGSMLARGGKAKGRNLFGQGRVTVDSLSYYPSGAKQVVTDRKTGVTYFYRRTHRARLVVEAHMNRLSLEELIHILRNDPNRAKKLTYLPNTVEVHHLDENPRNDALSNLMVLPRKEHVLHHAGEERFNKEYVKTARVVGIEHAGERAVYDISMEEPTCNFVVNDGIIVHNTGKSLTAKCISAALELPLYKFDVGAVFKGVVGQSESAIRNALKMAEKVAPCVLLIDEMEKLLAGLESSGKSDSGVTSRVVGTFLTWMQETPAPIYKVATCNTLRNLDSALFRRGRWDAVFAVDLPTAREREQIFAIHLARRGRDADRFDLKALADVTMHFVGAEIESVVDEALYIAFDAGRELTSDDLVRVARGVVPISKTDEEGINAFRAWMAARATPVSKQEAVRAEGGKKLRNLRVS